MRRSTPWRTGLILAAALAAPALAQQGPPVPDPSLPVEPLSPPVVPEEMEPPSAEPPAGAAPPAPMPRPGELREEARLAPGWSLRAVPDGSVLALAGGPGRVASVSVFCLGGAPWLALDLEPPPQADRIRVDFGFSGERVGAEALREEGAGGAYVLGLAEGPLAALLAGSGMEAALAIDGTQQGALSLAGSSQAIREALEACLSL